MIAFYWNASEALPLIQLIQPPDQEFVMKSITLVLLGAFVASTAHAAEKPSQAFIKKAIEGNHAEVQMGKLAQQNGQNEGVKKFGQMLSDDHSAANQKAIEAAKSMDTTAPDGPSAKQKADYDKMSKMSGRSSTAVLRRTW
jgi:putative membrane protein